MRSHFIRFGFILLSSAAVAAACTTAHRIGLPRGSEARVRGSGSPGTDGPVTKRLLDCSQRPGTAQGDAAAAHGRPTVARNGLGDVLEIPADAVPPETDVKIVRGTGRPYRWVEASTGSAPPPGRLTIDLRGCRQGVAGLIIVRWVPALSAWDSVGGTVTDSTITANLPHLSVYAVAGG
jgi:hypothetical protein